MNDGQLYSDVGSTTGSNSAQQLTDFHVTGLSQPPQFPGETFSGLQAEAFRGARSYFAETFSFKVFGPCAVVLACSAFVAYGNSSATNKLFEICDSPGVNCRSEPWKALFVANVLVLGIALMVQGWRSEFVLMSCAIIFGALKIISLNEALGGLAASGNITIQGIFILVRGVQDSGVLDRIFLTLLGLPTSRRAALLRSQLLSAVLSAFLQQQTVTMAGASAMEIWGPQVGLIPREVLLPFACAGGAGNNLFLASSAVSLTAAEMMPSANLGPLDTVYVCVVLTTFVCIYGTLFASYILGADGRRSGSVSESMVSSSRAEVAGDKYVLEFEVEPRSLLIGSTPIQVGFTTIAGISLSSPANELERPLAVGDKLCIYGTAAGIARFRRRAPGLAVKNNVGKGPLETLGGQRHRRCLFEAGLSPGSQYIGQLLPRSLPKAHVLSARRPGQHQLEGALQVGDVLLVEAFEEFAFHVEVQADFGFVAPVPESMPPRHGRHVDTYRGWMAAALLLGVMVLAVFNVCDIAFLSLIAVIISVATNVLHRDTVLHSLHLPIYLTIAGGLGLSNAIKASGLAHAAAEGVVILGDRLANGSPICMLMALSLVTALLANLMSNTATVAIMVPVAAAVCKSQGMCYKTACLVMIYSANAAYSTPFACSANMVIRTMGPYSFMDYVRFGSPLQLMSLIVAPLATGAIFGLECRAVAPASI